MPDINLNDPKYLTSEQWIYDTRVLNRDTGQDFVAVKTKLVTIDTTDEKIIHTEDKYTIHEHPKRTIYITKPEYRTYKDKKLFELISHCDVYSVEDKDTNKELGRILSPYGRYSRFTPSVRQLAVSPYVYGADIPIGSLIRMHYSAKQKHKAVSLTCGGYDHEQSVLGDSRINAIAIVCEHDVYGCCLADFTQNNKDPLTGKSYSFDEAKIKEAAVKLLAPYNEEFQFNIHYKICRDEIEMAKYIASQIHKHQNDFIGVWNMDYDIPSLMNRLEVNHTSFADIFHDPSIDIRYKHAKYRPDQSKSVQHYTDKWHWLHHVSKSQFMDEMLNFARIRKAKTREPKYTLDAIATKVLGKTKLAFEDANNHYEMQKNSFMRYCIYNLADAILVRLIFQKTQDHYAMLSLSGCSPLFVFSQQTTMLRDALYEYGKLQGKILGTAGANNEEYHATLLPKIGGTVLPIELLKEATIGHDRNHKGVNPTITMYNYDVDLKAIYPSVTIAFNIDKNTKRFTTYGINGNRDPRFIENYWGHVTDPIDNAVPICNTYFGLPDYQGMKNLFDNYLKIKLSNQNL